MSQFNAVLTVAALQCLIGISCSSHRDAPNVDESPPWNLREYPTSPVSANNLIQDDLAHRDVRDLLSRSSDLFTAKKYAASVSEIEAVAGSHSVSIDLWQLLIWKLFNDYRDVVPPETRYEFAARGIRLGCNGYTVSGQHPDVLISLGMSMIMLEKESQHSVDYSEYFETDYPTHESLSRVIDFSRVSDRHDPPHLALAAREVFARLIRDLDETGPPKNWTPEIPPPSIYCYLANCRSVFATAAERRGCSVEESNQNWGLVHEDLLNISNIPFKVDSHTVRFSDLTRSPDGMWNLKPLGPFRNRSPGILNVEQMILSAFNQAGYIDLNEDLAMSLDPDVQELVHDSSEQVANFLFYFMSPKVDFDLGRYALNELPAIMAQTEDRWTALESRFPKLKKRHWLYKDVQKCRAMLQDVFPDSERTERQCTADVGPN